MARMRLVNEADQMAGRIEATTRSALPAMGSDASAARTASTAESQRKGPASRHQKSSNPSTLNVRGFGAGGDSRTDDTVAFQQALNAAHIAGGGYGVRAARAPPLQGFAISARRCYASRLLWL